MSNNMTSQCPDGAELGNTILRCERVPTQNPESSLALVLTSFIEKASQ